MRYYEYDNLEVRDLAWLVCSPPLLRDSLDVTQFADPDAIMQWLEDVDHNPEPLRDYIAVEKRHTLGTYAERLLCFFLEHFTDVIATNLQIISEGRTLGECDVIFHHDGQYYHVECAVKFYLFHPDQAHHGYAAFIGANRHDCLADKRKRFATQLTLPYREESSEKMHELSLDTKQLRSFVFCKGWLFYPPNVKPPLDSVPHIHPDHLSGGWVDKACFDQHYTAKTWQSLEKPNWLSPQMKKDVEQLEGIALPQLLAQMGYDEQRKCWVEKTRLFVV